MKRNSKKQKNNSVTAKAPAFHDVVLPTAEEAEVVCTEARQMFDQLISGFRGEYFIKQIGNVVRIPSWFRVPMPTL